MGCSPSTPQGQGRQNGEMTEINSSGSGMSAVPNVGSKSKNTLGNDAYERGDYEDAIKCYTEALEQTEKRQSHPLYLVNRATAYHRLQEFDLAVADCLKSVSLEPNRRAYKQLVTTYITMLNYNGALDACKKVLELDPDDEATLNLQINLQIYLDKKAGDITRCFGLCCDDDDSHSGSLIIAPPATPPALKRGYSEMPPRTSGSWS